MLHSYPLKGKRRKAEKKFEEFLKGGALPKGLEEGEEPSADSEDDDDMDKSSDRGSSAGGSGKKKTTP